MPDAGPSVADPLGLVREALRIVWRALQRLWGRDVMLYVGGVSFFALLAIFPAAAIFLGLYSLLLTPEQALEQADAFARLMPGGAQFLFDQELDRLVHAPAPAVSVQSAFAVVIGAYAAHRGFKALLAGLSFIHEEENQRGFLGFNIMALVVLIAAFALLVVTSTAFVALRVVGSLLPVNPLKGLGVLQSEWTWTGVSLTIGLTLVYRYAMSRAPTGWRASMLGGAAAAALVLGASAACSVYVEQIAQLGATYGSISAVVVFLIWLSWNVNAVFYGGALATELERVLPHGQPAQLRFSRPSPRES